MAINHKIVVKEVEGVGAATYPVTCSIPLIYGDFQNTSTLNVTDSVGTVIPADFEILNRHYAKDNSIRHVLAHFNATTSASGNSDYFIKDDNAAIPAHVDPVSIVDNANSTVVTFKGGSYTFDKVNDTIATPHGQIVPSMLAYNRDTGLTELQPSLSNPDISYQVEYSGPTYSIIKVSAPATFVNGTTHRHGWAVRFYFYGDNSFVKMDFQIHNAPKIPRGDTLYFDEFHIAIGSGVAQAANSVSALELVTQSSHLDILGNLKCGGGISVCMRDFPHRFPNQLSVDTSGDISLSMYPTGGKKFCYDFQNGFTYNDASTHYWLDDMGACVKEMLIIHEDVSQASLTNISKTFQHPPVAIIDISAFYNSSVTTSMDGSIPESIRSNETNVRVPVYSVLGGNVPANAFDHTDNTKYRFGNARFACDGSRLLATGGTGNAPTGGFKSIMSGDPADFYLDLAQTMNEINGRMVHMPGFNYVADQPTLHLNISPASNGGHSWRQFLNNQHPEFSTHGPGFGQDFLENPMLPNTSEHGHARDWEHFWMYRLADTYTLTGNKWLKDFWEFMSEFMNHFVLQSENSPEGRTRSHGHAIYATCSAYKFTGNVALLNSIPTTFIATTMNPLLHPTNKTHFSRGDGKLMTEAGDQQSIPYYDSAFQMGFLLRALIDLDNELAADDPLLSSIIQTQIEYCYTTVNYAGYSDLSVDSSYSYRSGNNGYQLVCSMVWGAKKYNKPAYIEQLAQYRLGSSGAYGSGIFGGHGPYVEGYDEHSRVWNGGQFGNVAAKQFAGNYPVTGTGTFDHSFTTDGQAIQMTIDPPPNLTQAIIDAYSVNQNGEGGNPSGLKITGSTNLRSGLMIVVSIPGINNLFCTVQNGRFWTHFDNTNNYFWTQPSRINALLDGQTYTISATTTNAAGANVVSTVSMLIDLAGNGQGGPVTLTLSEITGNELTTAEQVQNLAVNGVTTATDGSTVTVAFNGQTYTTTAQGGAFSVSIPSIALQILTNNTIYIVSATTSGATDTEDFTTNFDAAPSGPTLEAASIDETCDRALATITSVSVDLIASTAAAYGDSDRVEASITSIKGETT